MDLIKLGLLQEAFFESFKINVNYNTTSKHNGSWENVLSTYKILAKISTDNKDVLRFITLRRIRFRVNKYRLKSDIILDNKTITTIAETFLKELELSPNENCLIENKIRKGHFYYGTDLLLKDIIRRSNMKNRYLVFKPKRIFIRDKIKETIIWMFFNTDYIRRKFGNRIFINEDTKSSIEKYAKINNTTFESIMFDLAESYVEKVINN